MGVNNKQVVTSYFHFILNRVVYHRGISNRWIVYDDGSVDTSMATRFCKIMQSVVFYFLNKFCKLSIRYNSPR